MKKQLRQLNALIKMSEMINSALDINTIKERAIDSAKTLLGAEAASLLLLDGETGHLYFEVAIGEKGEEVKRITLEPGQGIAGWVVENGEPVIINDVSSDKRFYGLVDKQTGFSTKRVVCVPLKLKEEIIGSLQVINGSEGDFLEEDMVILYALANQIAIALENAKLYEESITDHLTGLYHRKYLEARLEDELTMSKRHKNMFGLAFIDIDHFKKINDTYGHPTGDKVLKEISRLMLNKIRPSDVLSRYGGEEFALILPHSTFDGARDVCTRVRESVERLDFGGIKTTISAGFIHFDGKDKHCTLSNLVEKADEALYKAKREGRNRVEGTQHN